MRRVSVFGCSIAVSGLLACGSGAAISGESTLSAGTDAAAQAATFDRFVERLAAEWVRADPILASTQQYFSGAVQDSLDRMLIAKDFAYGIPLGQAARAQYVRRAQRGLSQLKQYSPAQLPPVERISAASLQWQLQDAIDMAALEGRRYVFEQFAGLHVNLVNFLSQTHPIRNARDVDNYLARLVQLGPVLDQGIIEAKLRERHGVRPPRFILEATLNGIDQFLASGPSGNVLVTSLDERASKVSGISIEQRRAARDRAESIVHDSIIPAFGRVRALLAAEVPHAGDDAGISALPDGTQPYAAFLRSNTTTDMTPEQVHELGLRQVARIEAEMDQVLRELGLTQGSVRERYEKLEASVQPPPDPDPRPMLLAQHEQYLRDAEKRAARLFDLRPTAAVRVEREPPFTEKTAAAHYTTPAPDGSLPGIVWIPLSGPAFKVLEMRTLTYHEGVPGHHFQLALQQESSELPVFRRKRVFGRLSAFTEGWGLYAEHLVAESGWYDGDPRGHLGQLSDELFRARRLVVDTGLHSQHWTRQQALDYGIPAAEVDRYVVWPGQACAYMVGELEILADRDRAKQALGGRFSLRQYHDWLLRTGAVPLAVLRVAIDAQVSAARP